VSEDYTSPEQAIDALIMIINLPQLDLANYYLMTKQIIKKQEKQLKVAKSE